MLCHPVLYYSGLTYLLFAVSAVFACSGLTDLLLVVSVVCSHVLDFSGLPDILLVFSAVVSGSWVILAFLFLVQCSPY